MILVLIDAHSKWIEVMVTPISTSTVVIEETQVQPVWHPGDDCHQQWNLLYECRV